MTQRRGLTAGSGRKGYYNVIGKDPSVHRMSAKGIKQPQRVIRFDWLKLSSVNNAQKTKDRLEKKGYVTKSTRQKGSDNWEIIMQKGGKESYQEFVKKQAHKFDKEIALKKEQKELAQKRLDKITIYFRKQLMNPETTNEERKRIASIAIYYGIPLEKLSSGGYLLGIKRSKGGKFGDAASKYKETGMTEQERTDNFVNKLGRSRAENLSKIWNNTYPRFMSINGEYPQQHSKEEVFEAEAKARGFKKSELDLFNSL